MARNKINDLRDHLFETLERLKDGDIDVKTAKAMADVGQVIINSTLIEYRIPHYYHETFGE